MSTKKDYAFIALNVISWIIFIGLCFEAGAIIFNAFFTLFYNPFGTGKLWDVMNLAELYNYNQSWYVTIVSLIIITAVLKALMFYLIVKIFHDKKFDLSHPFNEPVRKFIINIAWLALGIGLFSFWGAKDTGNFVAEGVNIPIVTQGKTYDELFYNLKEALILFLEDEDLSKYDIQANPAIIANLELNNILYA